MNLSNIPFTRFSPDDVSRPWLPVTIFNPHANKKVKVYGLIDTGADECAMPAQYATLIGHNLESGCRKEINTGNGRTIAYSHTVNIHVDDYAIKDVLLDFMPNLVVPLLGVKSFLSHFILTVNYPLLTFSLELKR